MHFFVLSFGFITLFLWKQSDNILREGAGVVLWIRLSRCHGVLAGCLMGMVAPQSG